MESLIDDWFNPGFDQLEQSTFTPWDDYDIPETIIGDPYHDSSIWHQQQTPFTCAVVSQGMILNSFGIEVSEAELVYEATSRGWLTENGTTVGDMANLLNLYGIETHFGEAGGVESLINELRYGHKVIVPVDSGELWNQEWFIHDLFPDDGADHAVMVTGLDMSNPDSPTVILNDPGVPEGGGMQIPLKDFLDAWNDSGQVYVATNDAPQNLAQDSSFGTNYNVTPDGGGQYMNDQFWQTFMDDLFFATSGAAFTYAASNGIMPELTLWGAAECFNQIDIDEYLYSV